MATSKGGPTVRAHRVYLNETEIKRVGLLLDAAEEWAELARTVAAYDSAGYTGEGVPVVVNVDAEGPQEIRTVRGVDGFDTGRRSVWAIFRGPATGGRLDVARAGTLGTVGISFGVDGAPIVVTVWPKDNPFDASESGITIDVDAERQ